MSGEALIIAATHDERGRLFAAVVPDVHHVLPEVRESRFAASLAPFRTRQAAETALLDAGAVIGGA